jgi:hypothetical protein
MEGARCAPSLPGKNIAMLRLDRLLLSPSRIAAVELLLPLLFAAIFAANVSHAEVRVDGPSADLVVNAREARIADVLSSLAAKHQVRYRASLDLDEVITGSYSGSLPQVLARVLDGYSYVIKKNEGALEVIVYGRRGERAIPASVPPPPPPPRNPATDWGQIKR